MELAEGSRIKARRIPVRYSNVYSDRASWGLTFFFDQRMMGERLVTPPFYHLFFGSRILDRYTEAQQICRMLTDGGFPTMLAGGCVRDRLFGKEPKDYDLAGTATPRQCMGFFSRKGYHTIPVGEAHGTICLVTDLQNLEITTLRRDVSCHGRKADVSFSKSFREDAGRRDFTINALFEDMDGQIHDYIDGLSDIRDKKLQFVGDEAQRIREDYLRILRYFRFLARLGWQPMKAPLTAIQHNLDGLALLSAERIHGEMTQILVAPFGPSILPVMDRCGVLSALFPWYNSGATAGLVARIQALPPKLPPLFYWFSLFFLAGHGEHKFPSLEKELQRLRFPRKHKKAILALVLLFRNLEDPSHALPLLLQLIEKKHVDPLELKTYFECSNRSGPHVPTALLSFTDGMIRHPAPRIPNETLMCIPPARRGKTIEMVKIYWFLGLCHDTKHMIQIMKEQSRYRKQLKSNYLLPVGSSEEMGEFDAD